VESAAADGAREIEATERDRDALLRDRRGLDLDLLELAAWAHRDRHRDRRGGRTLLQRRQRIDERIGGHVVIDAVRKLRAIAERIAVVATRECRVDR
jgi:hypothetical protein